MSSFTDLLATEGFVLRLIVPGAVCAPGLSMLAWRRLLGMMTAVVFVGMLSAYAAPPGRCSRLVSGRVEDLRLVGETKSCPSLNEFTLQAVKDAEIPPLPADVTPLLPKNDLERLRIESNVLIY